MTLSEIIVMVQRLKPGQSLKLANLILHSAAPPFIHHDVRFSSLDRIMEKLSPTSFKCDYDDVTTSFLHLPQPLKDGSRTYVSPDRRHLFIQRETGLWHPVKAGRK